VIVQRYGDDAMLEAAWHVSRNEVNVAVPERGEECKVAREPVELGNDQRRPGRSTPLQRLVEFGPVVPLPALHFDELRGDDATAATGDELAHGLTLSLKAET
jgi:hypothetical protein